MSDQLPQDVRDALWCAQQENRWWFEALLRRLRFVMSFGVGMLLVFIPMTVLFFLRHMVFSAGEFVVIDVCSIFVLLRALQLYRRLQRVIRDSEGLLS